MKPQTIKIIQQAAALCVACFLLWVAFSRSFGLTSSMQDVELGTHGNIALVLTVVLGGGFGIGLAGLFFYLARKQSADE